MSAMDILAMPLERRLVVSACAVRTLRFRDEVARIRQEQADG